MMLFRCQRARLIPDVPVLGRPLNDIAASGWYYIASGVQVKSTQTKPGLVRSIGVIFFRLLLPAIYLEKLVWKRAHFHPRRRNKAFLDPFSTMTDEARD